MTVSVLLLTNVASASTVFLETGDEKMCQNGNSACFDLVLDEAPGGLSGYILNLSVSDPSVAMITDVSYSAWADLEYPVELPAGSCELGALDLDEELSPGTKNVTLAIVTITGNRQGSADIIMKISAMDDHSGQEISPLVHSGEIVVDNGDVWFHPLPVVAEYDDPSHADQEMFNPGPDIKDEIIDVDEILLPELRFDASRKRVIVEQELSPGKTTTIDEKEFTIPSGAIVHHDQSGTTTVFDSSGLQLFAADDSEAEEVWTPGGPKPATHVHEVPSGSVINNQGNMTYVISKKQVILVLIEDGVPTETTTGSMGKSAPPDWPPGYIDGIEYTPTQDLKEFSSNWTVPEEPSDTDPSNVICMWNGLHRTTSYQGVIQPVVTWNEDGDEFFKGRVWQVTSSSMVKSSPISTRTGHEVRGTLTWDEELEYWKIILWDLDNYEATSLFSNIVPNTDCQIALMVESWDPCWPRHLFGYVIFHDITLQSMTGSDITPSVEDINVYITEDYNWTVKCPWLDIYANDWPDSILFRTGNSVTVPLPGLVNPPIDPDEDYFAEDLNGNGQIDLNDVVRFFKNIVWMIQNEPVDRFDFNRNAQIDLNDVVVLFREPTPDRHLFTMEEMR